jgi:hypothetical protein
MRNFRRSAGPVCCTSLMMFFTVGCIRFNPKMPPNLASAAPIAYSGAVFEQDVKAYEASVQGGKLDVAKTQRNEIAYRVMAQIDASYSRFEGSLTTSRAGAQTAGDAAQLGLTAAATVVGASGIKDILSATSTALQGTRLSFDKNFFEQKTTESLVSQMRASRKTLQAAMLKSLSTREVGDYPLAAAWSDLSNYYYSGTIPSALVDIASKAGADAVAADKTLQEAVKTLTPGTPETEKQAVTVRGEYGTLSTQIASADAAQAQAANDTLHKILAAAGVTVSSTASSADLLKAYRDAMAAADQDNAKLKALNDAVQAAVKK